MPEVRASDPNPQDLTPEEEAQDPAAEHPDEFVESPEDQAGG